MKPMVTTHEASEDGSTNPERSTGTSGSTGRKLSLSVAVSGFYFRDEFLRSRRLGGGGGFDDGDDDDE